MERKKSLQIQALEALVPRLSHRFPRYQDIQTDLAKRMKGYIGEKQMDYHLTTLDGPYRIIPDVHLTVNGDYFQIDTIILSQHAIYMIECKNFDGSIHFDTTLRQFTRNDGQATKGYRYPPTQAEKQKLRLQNWLLHHQQHQAIHVYYFIAIAEPSTIIEVTGDEQSIARLIAHSEHIPTMIAKVERQLSERGVRKIDTMTLYRLITQASREKPSHILTYYDIKPADIMPGVICPNCSTLGMQRNYGIWICLRCKHRSKNAHRRAIATYQMLIKPEITNQALRAFLKVKSSFVVTRLLKSSGYHFNHVKRTWSKINDVSKRQ